jgi:hypothetical protein
MRRGRCHAGAKVLFGLQGDVLIGLFAQPLVIVPIDEVPETREKTSEKSHAKSPAPAGINEPGVITLSPFGSQHGSSHTSFGKTTGM